MWPYLTWVEDFNISWRTSDTDLIYGAFWWSININVDQLRHQKNLWFGKLPRRWAFHPLCKRDSIFYCQSSNSNGWFPHSTWEFVAVKCTEAFKKKIAARWGGEGPALMWASSVTESFEKTDVEWERGPELATEGVCMRKNSTPLRAERLCLLKDTCWPGSSGSHQSGLTGNPHPRLHKQHLVLVWLGRGKLTLPTGTATKGARAPPSQMNG